MSLYRKKRTIRQFKWPDSYGARTAIWYRQRHNDAVDTRSLTWRHTERGIFLRYRGLSPVVTWKVAGPAVHGCAHGPPPTSTAAESEDTPFNIASPQGLPLFHISAEGKHFLWDTVGGASRETAQGELRSGRVDIIKRRLRVS